MQFYSTPDVTTTGQKKLSDLFATGSPSVPVTRARTICISCSGTGPVRFGDLNVGAAQGFQIPTAIGKIFRTTVGDITDWFDLTQCYIYVPAGTTASVIIGK